MQQYPERLEQTIKAVEDVVDLHKDKEVIKNLYRALINTAYLCGKDQVLIEQQQENIRKVHNLITNTNNDD